MKSWPFLLAISLGLGGAALVRAQTPSATWIATASGTWDQSANWSPGVPVSGSSTVLAFPAASGVSYTATQTLGEFSLAGLQFDAADGSTVRLAGSVGQSLTFAGSNGEAARLDILNSGATVLQSNLPIQLAANLAIQGIGSGALTFGAPLAGSGGLILDRAAGSNTLNALNAFQGETLIRSGTLTLGNRQGGLRGSPSVAIGPGGTLVLANGIVPEIGSRLGDNTPVILGGSLVLDAGTAFNAIERAGPLNLQPNTASVVTLLGSASAAPQLRFDDGTSAPDLRGLNRSAVLFRGPRLGFDSPGTHGSSTILFGQFPTTALVGSGGPDTPAAPILPFAVGDPRAAGPGSGFVTYDAAVGLRVLRAQEYANLDNHGAFDNVRVVASAGNLASRVVNSLVLAYPETAVTPLVLNGLPGSQLSITSGALLVTSDALAPATVRIEGFGNLDFGNRSAMIHVGGLAATTARITADLSGSGGLVKAGQGTLELAGALNNAGGLILGAGTVVLAHNGALGVGPLVISGGSLQVDVSREFANPIAILNDCTFGGSASQTLTLSGPVELGSLGAGDFRREIRVTNTTILQGALTQAATLTAHLTKSGPGSLVLAGSAELGGTLRVAEGALVVDGTLVGAASVAVLPQARLAGRGVIARAIEVQPQGTLQPGDSQPGRLTIAGPVTLQAQSLFAVSLLGPVAGNSYSQLDLSGGGSVQLANARLVPTLGYAPASTDLLTIITGGAIAGRFQDLADGSSFLVGMYGSQWYSATIQYLPSAVVLSRFQPVPEPTHLLVLAMTCGGLAHWRRRNRL